MAEDLIRDADALMADARRHMSNTYARPAWVAERGDGAWLYDTHGNAWLDLAGGIGVNALGHAHPQVVAAIAAQAAQLCHTSNALYHVAAIQLCTRLAALWPGPGCAQVFLCNSGTEAVEAALKLAKRFSVRGASSGRHQIVATEGGFHGRTMGALSVTGQPNLKHGLGPMLAGACFVPYNDAAAMAHAVTDDTAAVIVEPIQGNGGVIVAASGYLQALREICDAHGALLIFDEVQIGVGRTGHWLACMADDVVPDIVCLAKALGGGLPLGAIVAPASVMSAFTQGSHGSTFGGNPVACAAALATLDVIEAQGLLQYTQQAAPGWHARLRTLPHVKEVRGRGFLAGLACAIPAKVVRAACHRSRVLVTLAQQDVVRLFPPLNSTTDQLDEGIRRLDAALRSIT